MQNRKKKQEKNITNVVWIPHYNSNYLFWFVAYIEYRNNAKRVSYLIVLKEAVIDMK